jgi:ACS family tartrate transporter-like MFS transporter
MLFIPSFGRCDDDSERICGSTSFALIASVAQLGGFAGPYVIGFLNDRIHSLTAGFGFIALVYVVAGSLVLSLRIHDPEDLETKNEIPQKSSPSLPEPWRRA